MMIMMMIMTVMTSPLSTDGRTVKDPLMWREGCIQNQGI
jgi:hypothetical protein